MSRTVVQRSSFRWGMAILVLSVLALLLPSVSSALPTKLCKVNEATCSKENTVTPEHFAAGPGAMEFKLPGLATITCSSGKITTELEGTAGPLVGEAMVWNYFPCSPEGCSVEPPKTLETGYTIEIEATGGGNGSFRIGEKPVLIVKCTGFPKYTCFYGLAEGSTMNHFYEGGAKTLPLSINLEMVKDVFKSSLACPNTGVYAIEYWTTSPGAYVTN